MSFFESYFDDVVFTGSETAVCCPFDHYTSSGTPYLETNPSAHVNTDKGLFHCKVCTEGRSEVGFIAEIFGCSYEHAIRLQKLYKGREDKFTWQECQRTSDEWEPLVKRIGIRDSVRDALMLSTETETDIQFPVFMYDKLLDVRTYQPNGKPKIKSRTGTISGLILPFDIWRHTPKSKWTIICAGEKDMAVARSFGFNAITITGGEQALPKFINEFKERKIAICYDNDDAGISGAYKLAAHLYSVAEEVKVITGFHEICTNKGEDITDFFMKYRQPAELLKDYIKGTDSFSDTDVQKQRDKTHPIVSLLEASRPQYINKVVRSNIQVVATMDKTYVVPTTLIATKINRDEGRQGNTMALDEQRHWYLSDKTAEDILHLIDNNFTEGKIAENIRSVMKPRIPLKEKYVAVSKPTKESVFKCSVTDLFEMQDSNTNPIEYTAYSIKKRLESGKKYRVTYKLVPHPYKGQELLMIILDVEEAADSIANFTLNENTKTNLDVIKNINGTVTEKIDILTERVKGILNYDGYNTLIKTIDLSFHTVLTFDFGNFKDIRGYLDTLVVTESRIGKSTTAEALMKTYGLGTFISLAGSSATTAGIIGGSNKVNGSFQTRAGLIPQNHKGLIILEELAKANNNIIKELTDIRSSNEVRIARVNGSINLPALVRMITLSNVRTHGASSRSISSFPNGIEILVDLIGSPEDIARYDMMLVLDKKGANEVDPFWEPQSPLATEVYRDRIRWIWSRSASQVIIEKTVGHYIMERCNELNRLYHCHIKIFGTEAWKKVSRLAVAIAGYLVSTDDTYENIVVTKEHVDYAVQHLIDIYDNQTFKLKEFVNNARRFSEIDANGIALLQDCYMKSPTTLLQLEGSSSVARNSLEVISGLDSQEFKGLMATLVKGLFIKLQGYDIVPTEKFRKGMAEIERNITVHRLGETDA